MNAKEPQSLSDDHAPHYPWSVRRRAVVSVLLALHLIAVISAPLAIPGPSAELSRKVADVFSPYLHATHLYNGYRFFAPNPGPSHVVRYELTMPDGNLRHGRFPNLNDEWPRQLYHRHFMISETVFNLMNIPSDEEMTARANDIRAGAKRLRDSGHESFARHVDAFAQREEESFASGKQQRELLLTAIAQRLLADTGAVRVRLFVQTHLIPTPIDSATGRELDDPTLYVEEYIGEFTREVEP